LETTLDAKERAKEEEEEEELEEESMWGASKIPQFLFFFYVAVVSLNAFHLFFPARCTDETTGRRSTSTKAKCVFPTLRVEDDFRVHVYVSDTKNERKVMEEVISESAKRSETEEDDPAEEDRRAFSDEFDGQLRRDSEREMGKETNGEHHDSFERI
jgi:hypothetical protein